MIESKLDLSTLNDKQFEAVEHVEGPIVIYAGAGSGKTRVICYRIARLIDKGIPPSSIMAVTFTNKAAREMRERIEGLVGHRAKNLIISTFHSACARFLRIYAKEAGFTESFSIYDDDDQKALLKDCFKSLNVNEKFLSVSTIKSRIDKLKNQGETVEAFAERIRLRERTKDEFESAAFRYFGEDQQSEILLACYELYQKKLRAQNAMDFNDLILVMATLLEQNQKVLEQLQNRFRFFCVDEFQDTNPIQFRLIKLLSSHTNNLCIVGDDDQSIYSWRGAEPAFILDFEKLFPGTTTIKLEQNYRSTGTIIKAATHIVSRNLSRAQKTLWTQEEAGEPITLKKNLDAQDEADFICNTIVKDFESGGKFSDFAILYRTNAQSRALEDALRRRMLPYVIFGSVRFYERAEIKVLLAYLRLLVNPDDDAAFQKAISTPRRGFGEKGVLALKKHADQDGTSLARVAAKVARNEISIDVARGLNGLKEFVNLFSKWKGSLDASGRPSLIIAEITQDIGFEEYLRANYPEDFDDRWLNVLELRNALVEYEARFTEDRIPGSSWQGEVPAALRGSLLASFLEEALLTVEPNVVNVRSGSAEAITLMTIHSAKGLEFEKVFLSGLEEGILPHMNSLESDAAVEEERRLMYVALTRARKRLTLTHIERNRYKGDMRAMRSRFLDEIPQECLKSLDVRRPAPSFGQGPTFTQGSTATLPRRDPASFVKRADDLLATSLASSASEVPWAEGQHVRHKIFGVGVVQKVEKSLDGFRLEVRFPQAGIKRLMHTYVTPL